MVLYAGLQWGVGKTLIPEGLLGPQLQTCPDPAEGEEVLLWMV